ncbi:hypothetical protein C446_01343 [Halobiforma nitratireducens JCM 10879]|uniref:Uncharacterized protein n=1 Tax=Halobiforma nitratireducens JCM 10879 TaxID=1227454 RepID=M0MLA2_9EURY|nr:hypothetical protein C446_01343 [Halobiforma nitratireducens JCM 10879]
MVRDVFDADDVTGRNTETESPGAFRPDGQIGVVIAAPLYPGVPRRAPPIPRGRPRVPFERRLGQNRDDSRADARDGSYRNEQERADPRADEKAERDEQRVDASGAGDRRQAEPTERPVRRVRLDETPESSAVRHPAEDQGMNPSTCKYTIKMPFERSTGPTEEERNSRR